MIFWEKYFLLSITLEEETKKGLFTIAREQKIEKFNPLSDALTQTVQNNL